MELRTGRFRRSDRLRHPRDFKRVSQIGQRAASRYFVVLVAPSGESTRRGEPCSPAGLRRLGITASRKVGNAIARNRVKRAVREWFRRERHRLERDVDLVVIARREAAALTTEQVVRVLNDLVKPVAPGGQR